MAGSDGVTKVKVAKIGDVELSEPFEMEVVFDDVQRHPQGKSDAWLLSQGSISYQSSITLKELVTLLQSYFLHGEDVTGLFRNLRFNTGIMTADASYFKPGENGGKTIWTVCPDKFQLSDGVWSVQKGPYSEEYPVDLPPSGYVLLTDGGLFRHDTGSPLATADEKEQAIESYRERGIEPDKAKGMQIYFSSGGDEAKTVDGATCVGFWKKTTKKASDYFLSANLSPAGESLLCVLPVTRYIQLE
jgi:hypothetical protein